MRTSYWLSRKLLERNRRIRSDILGPSIITSGADRQAQIQQLQNQIPTPAVRCEVRKKNKGNPNFLCFIKERRRYINTHTLAQILLGGCWVIHLEIRCGSFAGLERIGEPIHGCVQAFTFNRGCFEDLERPIPQQVQSQGLMYFCHAHGPLHILLVGQYC